ALTAQLNGALPRYKIHLDVDIPSLTRSDQPIGHLRLTSIIQPNQVSILNSSLSGPHIRAEGNGDIPLPWVNSPFTFPLESGFIRIASADLSLVSSLGFVSHQLSGILTGEIVVTTPAQPQTLSTITIRDFSVAGTHVGELDVTARIDRAGISDLTIVDRIEHGEMTIRGDVPFGGPITCQASGSLLPITLIPGSHAVSPSGLFSFTADLPGSPDAVMVASFLGDNLILGDMATGPWTLSCSFPPRLPLEITWTAEWLDALKGHGSCTVTKGIPFTGHLTMRYFPLEVINHVASSLKNVPFIVSGVASGAVQFTGSLEDPVTWVTHGELEELDGTIAGIDLAIREPTSFRIDADAISIGNTHFSGQGADFFVGGMLHTHGDLALAMTGNIDLNSLKTVTKFIDSPSGNLEFDIRLGGTWVDPEYAGNLFLQEFYCYIPAFDIWLEDYHSEILLDEKIGKIAYLEGIAGGSYFGGEGELGFSRYIPDLLDISLSGDEVDFQYPVGFRSQANLELDLAGRLYDMTISGDIALNQSAYSERINYKTMIVNESRARLALTKKHKSVRPLLPPSAFNPRFNLRISGSDNIFVTNNLARVEMALKLNLLGSLNKPQLLGHIDVLHGDVTLLQRNFELTSASLEFADPLRIDPIVNVQAATDIDEYQVTLDISGQLYSDLSIQPSSTPPLNELDLWNLIVVGKTRDTMTSSSDYLASGVAYVTGSLQEQIEQRFEYWMGFDEFSIDPIMSTSDESPSAKFTVKKRFGPDLTALYSRSATSSGDLLVIQYEISDNLFIIGQKSEDNSIGADIRYRWEFE
ncbi:translocation/assembly module TamB domain-containing protein, partial [bacterium]|nr:translocation/assembly module TamB domain-containing protein [candidate division CSSED10-310 bacterium]